MVDGSIWTAIGTILSIIGAVISIYMAHRAYKHASEAKRYRNEVQSKHGIINLQTLYSESASVKKECAKLATPAESKHARGVDYQKVVDGLREYVTQVNENSHYFDKPDEINDKTSEMLKKLSEFAQEGQQDKKNDIGDMIYKDMMKLTSLIKRALDMSVLSSSSDM